MNCTLALLENCSQYWIELSKIIKTKKHDSSSQKFFSTSENSNLPWKGTNRTASWLGCTRSARWELQSLRLRHSDRPWRPGTPTCFACPSRWLRRSTPWRCRVVRTSIRRQRRTRTKRRERLNTRGNTPCFFPWPRPSTKRVQGPQCRLCWNPAKILSDCDSSPTLRGTFFLHLDHVLSTYSPRSYYHQEFSGCAGLERPFKIRHTYDLIQGIPGQWVSMKLNHINSDDYIRGRWYTGRPLDNVGQLSILRFDSSSTDAEMPTRRTEWAALQ